jgi:hypothetical protein
MEKKMATKNGNGNGNTKKDALAISEEDALEARRALAFKEGALEVIDVDGEEFEEAIDEKSFPFWTPQNDMTDHPALIAGTIMKRYMLPERDGMKARPAISLRGAQDWCVPLNPSLESQLGSNDNPDPRAVVGKAIVIEYVGSVKVKKWPNPMNQFRVFFRKEKKAAVQTTAQPTTAQV